MKSRLLALSLVYIACGPKPKPLAVPVLPGDGDAHVAKPPPGGDKAAPDAWAGKQLIEPPAANPPQKLDLPPVEEYKLSNGLQVFVVRSDRMPVASFQLAIKAGRMHEPRAKLGIAEATANMLVKGTTKHDAIALARSIDQVGGTIAADATYEATLVSCSVLAKNASTCMDLLPEMLTQPTFPDAELVKVKEQMHGEVRQRLDDAGTLASSHAQNLLWGNDHVRGWFDSDASIDAIARGELVDWHKTWFVPNNAMLVVTGDVDAKKLRADLERTFSPWKKGTVPPAPSYGEPGLSGIRIRLVDKPGQTQTHVRVAQFGIKHDDPRFFDALVFNYTLGGGAFSSRLMRVVRVEGGKTYGASSAFDRNLDRGSFVAQTFTRNSETVATTKLIIGEIAKMAKEGPSQAEIDAAIANLAGSYGMRFQSASDIGAALLAAELHGFGTEYLENYALQVGKVDQASAKRAASEILDPKNYVVVLVGDAKDIEPQLKAAGWRYEKRSFADPITPEAKQPDAPVDATAAAAVKKLVEDALVAKGGRAKVAAIKALRMTATGTTAFGPQTVPVEIERLFVLPDKMRIDAELAKQIKVTITVSGKNGWQKAPNQQGQIEVADIPPDAMVPYDFERWREPELILLKAADKDAKLAPAPDETLDGKPQSVVKLSSPFGLDVMLYIDKKTKLLTRMSYKDAGLSQTDDFADYRDVAGVKVAYKRKSVTQGRSTDLTVDKVDFAPKIDATAWDKPAS
jgi:zinc protease